MASDKFIWQRGDTFHFRRRLDSRISGSQTISISMKTRCPDRVRILARRLAARWDMEIAMLAQPLTNQLSPAQRSQILKNAMVEELGDVTMHLLTEPYFDPASEARRALHYATAFDDGRRDLGDPTSQPSRPRQSDVDEKLIDMIRGIYVCRETMEEISAPRELEKVGAAPTFANRHIASLLMLSGWAEARRRCSLLDHPALRARADWDAALLDDDLIASIRAAPSVPVPQPNMAAANDDFPFANRDERLFSEVIDEIIETKIRLKEWRKDRGDQKRVLSIFAWVTGNKRLFEYRQEDIATFNKAYELAPPGFIWMKHIKADPQPTWAAVSADFKLSSTTQRSNATYNRDIGVIQAACVVLAKTAWKSRTGDELVIKTGERKRVEPYSDHDPKRMPWTTDHLRLLFSSTIYTGGGGVNRRLKPSDSPNIWQDAAYWVPLLAAYSGAGREELCGLELDDVIIDTKIPHFWIRDNMTRSRDGIQKAGAKATSRIRHVPIHPELLRLGFADYVRAMAKEKSGRLFPELYIIKTGGGARFYSRAWQHMVNAVDAKLPLLRTSDDKRADFHSLRTYSESVLCAIEVNQTYIDKILGHAPVGTGAKSYNRRKLALGFRNHLEELLKLMVDNFPVVTSHLTPAPLKLLALSNRSRTGEA